MSRFKASSGLFHYLIANDDVYYTDAMIRLNLQDYLYYELKMEHYEYVFNVTGSSNKYYLKLFDIASYRWAINQMKGFLGKYFGDKNEEYDGKPVEITGEKVRDLLRKARNSAFVFRLNTFCSIYNGFLSETYHIMTEYSDSGNIVILQMDSSAANSLSYLMDDKSVLRGKYLGKVLFPEITESFNAERLKSGRAYSDFIMKTGNRSTCYNSFTTGAIRRVMNYVVWVRLKKEAECSPEELNKIVRFIYAWYRSRDMQLVYHACLSANYEHSYKILTKDIERHWNTLIENAADWDEKNSKGDIDEEIYVTEDSDVLSGLKSIIFPAEYTNETDLAEMKREWMYLYREYSKPHGEVISNSIADTLKFCVDVMGNAVRNRDKETFHFCNACLRYGLNMNYNDDEKARKIWKAYQNLIAISQDCFALNEAIRIENASIKEWTEELDAIIQRVREMDLSVTPESVKNVQKSNAVTLRKKINIHKNYVNDCINRKKKLAETQNALDVMVESDFNYNIDQFQKIIDSSSQIIEQFTRDYRDTQGDVEKVGNSIDELEFGFENQDVDSDYRSMLKWMNASNNGNGRPNESEVPDNLNDMILL